MPKSTKKGLLLVKDGGNRAIYRIDKNKEILDMKGNSIAKFSNKEKKKIGDKTEKVSVYNSNSGTFNVAKNKVLLNDVVVGVITTKGRGMSNLLLLGITLFSIVSAIAFVIMITTFSGNPIPIFDVVDNDGHWEELGTVAVFDSKVYPGATGKYDFIMTNESTGKLRYSFSLEEKYDGEEEFAPFMEYQLKMNNIIVPIDNNPVDKWYYATDLRYDELVFLPTTQQLMTLEWKWEYEAGRDEQDTRFGIDNGKYSIVLNVKAEVYVE